jgi:PAS domain S-box-containing protein
LSTSNAASELPGWALGDPARIETDLDGLVVSWNRAAEELYGFPASAAIGQPIVRLIVPLRGRDHAGEIMEALALGRSWEGEFDVRRRDGRLIRVLVHDAPSYDAAGAFAGVVGHSVPVASARPVGAASGPLPAVGSRTRALTRAIFDPSVQAGTRTRGALVATGVGLEVAWSFAVRELGRAQAVGVVGAIAVIGVLAIAIVDVWAGVAVALVGGAAFVVIVLYSGPPDPFAFGLPLIAIWVASALAAGFIAKRLRAQAQRGMAEAIALHRELVGSLVPAPRLRRLDVSVASLYRPGEQRLELGGDFYAAIERPNTGLALLIGDVSGHGPAAAGLAAMLRAGWEALVEADVPPEVRLQSLNYLLLEHAQYEEFFATVCSVVIDPSLREAKITLAGHPPPILLEAGATVPLAIPAGAPLGVSDLVSWKPTAIALPPSFSLVLYTDGVIEGRAAAVGSERFGEQRLRDVLCRSQESGHALLQDVILAASSAHGGALPDDAALLLLEHGLGAVPSTTAARPGTHGAALEG